MNRRQYKEGERERVSGGVTSPSLFVSWIPLCTTNALSVYVGIATCPVVKGEDACNGERVAACTVEVGRGRFQDRSSE